MAKDMEVADYVTFTGRIDDAKLFTMLSTADVCVNPDRVTAMNDISTMNKIMEYMALGKPIVQFDVKEGRVLGARRIALRQGQRYRRFRRESLRAHRRSGAAPRMGEYGRKRVEEALAWHHEQPKLLNAYAKLAELRGRRWKFLNRDSPAAFRIARRMAAATLDAAATSHRPDQKFEVERRICGSVCSDLAMWEPFVPPVSPTAATRSSASTRQRPRSI